MTIQFSWEDAKQKAIETKIRRHLKKCNQCVNPSGTVSDKKFRDKYAGDINILVSKQPNTPIINRIRDEVLAKQEEAIIRREKTV